MRTAVSTDLVFDRPVAASRTVNAVTTKCFRPLRARSIRRASAAVCGWPMMRSPSTTSVSAAMIRASGCLSAAFRAFPMDSSRAIRRGPRRATAPSS